MKFAQIIDDAWKKHRSSSVDEPGSNSSHLSSLFKANKARYKGPNGEHKYELPALGNEQIDIQIGTMDGTSSDYPTELKRIKRKVIEELETNDVAFATEYRDVLQASLKDDETYLDNVLHDHFMLHRSDASSDHHRSYFDSSVLAKGFSKNRTNRSR